MRHERITVVDIGTGSTRGDHWLAAPMALVSMHLNSRSAFAFGTELRAGPVFGSGRGGSAALEIGLKIGAQL